MSIIIFIVIILVLVVSHEFGHFIVAKKSGIRVDEFAFGFKPRLFSIKKGETEYSFNALPIGGYVKIFGENPDEESMNGPDRDRSFINKPKYIQALVLIAGVTMNFLVAWLLISIGFMSGLPSSVSSAPASAKMENVNLVVIDVNKNSPAEKAGLKTGDKIIHLQTAKDSVNIDSIDSLQSFVKSHNGENISVSFMRGPDAKETNVIPEKSNVSNVALIGISMDMIGTLKLSIPQAIWEGLKLSSDLFITTLKGFYNLIIGSFTGHSQISSLTGPVGIVGVVGDAVKFGFIYLLSFTALISINLAVINLMPFPALDGGRLLFLLIEKIKGSRINPKVANTINLIGFSLLILLMVVITYHDIVKLL